MEAELMFQGSYCIARIDLEPGEEIKAQADAMVAMDSNVVVEGKATGGVMGMLKRSVTGESMFMQTLKSTGGKGEVYVAPSEPGDIVMLELKGSLGYCLQKGAFLASEKGVDITVVSQGLMKGLFSREGFFIQKAKGRGKLIISSFGGIFKKTLAANETWIVDNGHLVAWSESINYEIKKATSGLMSSFTSGEGFVAHVKGPGDVYVQTRNPSGFGAWVRQFLEPK